MNAPRDQPRFGLASTDEDGRKAALAMMEKVNAAFRRVNDRLGRRAFRAIELQSAPTGGRLGGGASPAAFTRSLIELGEWQWDGAKLSVEHCDSAQAGVPQQKGVLAFERRSRRSRRPTAASHGRSAGRSGGAAR